MSRTEDAPENVRDNLLDTRVAALESKVEILLYYAKL
jgi:hypothetical protein